MKLSEFIDKLQEKQEQAEQDPYVLLADGVGWSEPYEMYLEEDEVDNDWEELKIIP